MTGAGVRIDLDFDGDVVRRALVRLVGRIEDTAPIFDELGARLVTSVLHRFETERGPGGTQWKKSHRAKREGGQTLTDRKSVV